MSMERSEQKMKKRVSDIFLKAIKKVAFMSSETTSGAGLYQPKTPKALIRSDKK